MKPRLKHSAFVLLIGAGSFLSCSKSEVPHTIRFPPPPPSLSGQEFLFDSLTWTFLGFDDIYLRTPPRTDLFPWLTFMTYVNAQVSMKFDTASNWVDVKSLDLYLPTMDLQYLYWTHSHSLYVDMLPLDYQLIGRKASIKIKFL